MYSSIDSENTTTTSFLCFGFTSLRDFLSLFSYSRLSTSLLTSGLVRKVLEADIYEQDHAIAGLLASFTDSCLVSLGRGWRKFHKVKYLDCCFKNSYDPNTVSLASDALYNYFLKDEYQSPAEDKFGAQLPTCNPKAPTLESDASASRSQSRHSCHFRLTFCFFV